YTEVSDAAPDIDLAYSEVTAATAASSAIIAATATAIFAPRWGVGPRAAAGGGAAAKRASMKRGSSLTSMFGAPVLAGVNAISRAGVSAEGGGDVGTAAA